MIQDKGEWRINKEGLRDVVWLAVRFLDDAIDVSEYPLDKITEMARGNRKIGLGVMGFADMLFKMGITYSSEKALSVAEDVMSFFQSEARKASIALAEERGVFRNFEISIFFI